MDDYCENCQSKSDALSWAEEALAALTIDRDDWRDAAQLCEFDADNGKKHEGPRSCRDCALRHLKEIAALKAEVESFRDQNERIADMRIEDCKRAEAAEAKIKAAVEIVWLHEKHDHPCEFGYEILAALGETKP